MPTLSTVLLALGVLCGLWDSRFGERLYGGYGPTLRRRAAFAWKERRLTIIGGALVLASVVVGVLD